MPLLRPYVPSAAVLRALSRPTPLPCPIRPRLPAQFIRGKQKVANREVDVETRAAQQEKLITRRLLKKARELGKEEAARIAERPPLPTDTMSDMGLPEFQYWEQDLDKPGRPMTLIAKVATRADLEKQQRIQAMREERNRDPNYDDAELNRILMDELIANPNFADLTEQLEWLKSRIKTKEEKAEIERKANEENEPLEKEIAAMVSMGIDEALQDILDDPNLAEFHQDARDVRSKISEDGTDTPEFMAAMQNLENKLEGSEVYRQKAAKWKKENPDDGSLMEEWRELEALFDAKAEVDNMKFDDFDDEWNLDEADNKEDLLVQMRELLGAMNDDKSKEIVGEIDALLAEDPIDLEESSEDEIQELDYDFVVNEIKKIQENPPPESSSSDIDSMDTDGTNTDSTDTDPLDPELEAKIDQILEDPELLEKLAYMTKMIKKQKDSLTNPDIESPPDPLTLSDSETSTLAERFMIAENDPEHIAAMRRLRIKLTPPFNVSPALRSLNQALKFAYCCSNDGVRRLLWRSYSKARSLPTLLQNMPDDAWDMMYYSQAVKWVGNENREQHLKVILQDLKSIGRDGPPTHPRTLKKGARNDEEDGYI